MDFNSWYKRIRQALELDKRNVAEIMHLGDLPQSLSEIEGWQRRSDDARRYRTMTEAQFDAFTSGLLAWVSQQDK